MSFDAESFVDEGNKEAGLPVAVEVDEAPPVETETVAEPAPEPEKPTAEPSAKSFLVREPEAAEAETETMVPVHVVADLRAKNRELREQLEQAQTRPAAENAEIGPDPLQGLDDDDLLTPAKLKEVREYDRKVAEAGARRAQQQSAQTSQQGKLRQALLENEQQTRQVHTDYDAVMEAADGYLSPADFHAALQTKNPAKVLYAKAKQVTAALGIEIKTPVSKETKPEIESPQADTEVIQTDDEVFAEIFGKRPAAK